MSFTEIIILNVLCSTLVCYVFYQYHFIRSFTKIYDQYDVFMKDAMKTINDGLDKFNRH